MAQDNNDSTVWFLRTGPNAVHGELALKVLVHWAEQGRILASNEVSRDGEEWIPASELPELKMDWHVTLKSGITHGPLNLLCIPALYRRGIVNEEAVLENRKTGKKMDAALFLRGLHNRDDDSPRSVKTGKIGPRLPHGLESRPVSATFEAPVGVDVKGARELAAVFCEIGDELADLAHAVSGLGALATSGADEPVEPAEIPREEAPAVIAALIQQDLASWAKDARNRVMSAAAFSQTADAGKGISGDRETATDLLQLRIRELESELAAGEAKFHDRVEAVRKEYRQIVENQNTAYEALQAKLADGGSADAQNQEQRAEALAEEIDTMKERHAAEVSALKEDHDSTVRRLKAELDEVKNLAQAGDGDTSTAALQIENIELAKRDAEQTAVIARLKQEIAGLYEEMAALKQNAPDLSAEKAARVNALIGELDSLRRESQQKDARLASAEGRAGDARKEAEAARAELMRLAGELETLRGTERSAAERESALRKEVETLARERSQADADSAARADLEEKIAGLEKEKEALAKAAAAQSAKEAEKPAPPPRSLTQWYLQLEDGKEFGPVSLNELLEWASDCRIGPDHSVSEDRSVWKKASEVDDLRMLWKVELADGTSYGPLNLFAVGQLIHDGVTSADAPVTHVSDGTAGTFSTLVSAEIKALLDRERELVERWKGGS